MFPKLPPIYGQTREDSGEREGNIINIMLEISFLPELSPVHSDVRDFLVWLVWFGVFY